MFEKNEGKGHSTEELRNLIHLSSSPDSVRRIFALHMVQDLPRGFARVLRVRVKFLCVFLLMFVISHQLSLPIKRSVNQSQQGRSEDITPESELTYLCSVYDGFKNLLASL